METNALREQYLALNILTRRFATLLEVGVRLTNILITLREDSPTPYREAMQTIYDQVLANKNLTQVISDMPDLFPPIFPIITRSGEVGGILEEAYRYLADLLEEDWKYSQVLGWGSDRPFIFFPTSAPLPESLASLDAAHRALLLSIFCRCLGMMLSSGVPIIQAMEVAADILPDAERKEWLAMRERIRQGARLDETPFLTPFIKPLISIGEKEGSLDRMLLKTADTYHHEVECRLWRQFPPEER